MGSFSVKDVKIWSKVWKGITRGDEKSLLIIVNKGWRGLGLLSKYKAGKQFKLKVDSDAETNWCRLPYCLRWRLISLLEDLISIVFTAVVVWIPVGVIASSFLLQNSNRVLYVLFRVTLMHNLISQNGVVKCWPSVFSMPFFPPFTQGPGWF